MKNTHRDNKGKFLPGHRPAGRKKGSGNKISNEVKKKLKQLLDNYSIEQMKDDLMKLEPAERLRITVSLSDYFIPKLNRTDNNLNIDNEIIVVMPNSTPN